MDCLMGIDIGTSSLKTIVIDTTGNILAHAAFEYKFDTPSAGFAEQDPEVWWEALIDTVENVLSKGSFKADDIKGIGFSGQMHGMVPLDKDGNVLRNSILHCDVRSTKQADHMTSVFYEDQVGEILYNPIFPGMQLVSLLWMKDNVPWLYEKVRYVLCPKDYIRFKLTGEIGTERTDASGTLAYNMKDQVWAKDVLSKLGIDSDIFPQIAETPYQMAGSVSDKAAKILNLRAGTPVVFGGGDQSMQSIGNGLYLPGDMMVTIGTSGQAMMITDSPVYNPSLNTNTFAHVEKDRWFGLAGILNAGVTLNWFKRTFLPQASYRDLTDMATRIEPGSNGLAFFPAMMGERTPYLDPDTRGIFFGFSFIHEAPHFIRAIMEGVSFEIRTGIDILADMYGKPSMAVAAGGANNSPEWLQIQADIYGIPLSVKPSYEQACLGAAIMAGVGCGIYSSTSEGCLATVPKEEKSIEPIPERVKIYDEIYHSLFVNLYEQNKKLFKTIKEGS